MEVRFLLRHRPGGVVQREDGRRVWRPTAPLLYRGQRSPARAGRVTGHPARRPRDLAQVAAEVRDLPPCFAPRAKRLCLRGPHFAPLADGWGARPPCRGEQGLDAGGVCFWAPAQVLARLAQAPAVTAHPPHIQRQHVIQVGDAAVAPRAARAAWLDR
jgi:hypothetical protein